MDKVSLCGCILFGLFLRCGVSLNKYSGAGKPPMFGDYEAQRHWMEITLNLPIQQWYNGSKENDLHYWGLDYPPLTAYHSKLCGFIANLINKDWVALHKSRGFESYQHKFFMRMTVVVVDLLVYFVGAVYYTTIVWRRRSQIDQMLFLLTFLSYPGLILIDHGHFQYNCVSLGLTLISTICMLKSSHVMASIFFVLALNYKQMELYHAFPYFFYLLAISWKQKTWMGSIIKLTSIGTVVIITFIICWLPFMNSIESMLIVLQRLFPFNRGLFEDKVANVWCTISVVFKIKNILSQQRMVQLCLVTTLLACVPSCYDLLRNPTRTKFLYSMINCPLAFFLFSYQVHEKSILIPALSVCLIYFEKPLAATWFLILSTFSMYPLLVRDGQTVSYFVLLVVYIVLSSFLYKFKSYSKWLKTLVLLSISGCILLHIAFATIKPPQRLPDIFPLLFAAYSCLHFVLFWFYFVFVQLICPKQDSLDVGFNDELKKIN